MRSWWKILAIVSMLGAASPALAGDVSAEAKAAKGVENKQPVDEGTEFAAGDTVWIWTRVKGAAGTEVQHVWKRDGKHDWTAKLQIRGKNWTTNSRRKVKPGEWIVEVVAAGGTKLTEVAFSVK